MADRTLAMNIVTISDGVQMYLISPDGRARALSADSSNALSIMKFEEKQSKSESRPPAFLIAGDWIYPLFPGRSPVLRSCWGPYIFPDVSPGAAEGECGVNTMPFF